MWHFVGTNSINRDVCRCTLFSSISLTVTNCKQTVQQNHLRFNFLSLSPPPSPPPPLYPSETCSTISSSRKRSWSKTACLRRSIYARAFPSSRVMQSQLVCNGCRSVLLYPRGAANVCCAICNTITSVPSPGMEMSQIVCGGCRTLLMYTRGATSVRCSCCHTINLARPASNQVAHVNCGQCHTMLMYPYGAPSVKCAVCHYVTNIGMGNMRVPTPSQRPNGATMPASIPSTSTPLQHSHSQTVVVENPMSVDESGKLVSNVVVGVTSEKKGLNKVR